MLERLQDIFVRVTGITDFVITPKTKLNKRHMNISSFTLIQLYCELEDEFDIEIPNSAVKKMKSVKDIMDYLSKHANV